MVVLLVVLMVTMKPYRVITLQLWRQKHLALESDLQFEAHCCCFTGITRVVGVSGSNGGGGGGGVVRHRPSIHRLHKRGKQHLAGRA